MFRKLCVVVCAVAVGGCGGGGSSCDEGTRKDAVLSVARSWYLYQELLPALSAADYADADALLAALTAPARAAGKDRGWSFLMETQAYDQYYGAGQSTGFGWSLAPVGDAVHDVVAYVVVRQVFAGSAAAQAGFVRGDRIEAVGATPAALVGVAGLTSGEVGQLLSAAPALSVRVLPRGGATTAVRTLAVGPYDVAPVPLRWISGTTGYVQLRTFIEPAEADLRAAFADFKTHGVTDLIVDLRYNGGGSVATAVVLANLLGGGLEGERMFELQYNAGHADLDRGYPFGVEPAAGAFRRVAFITTRSSASASELVPNALDPYRTATTLAYVGGQTYGKPVGQHVWELQGCDSMLFLISFRLVNAAGDADYYAGLPDAASHAPLCDAADDFDHDQGGVDEGMTAAARYFVENGACATSPGLRARSGLEELPLPVGAGAGPAARDMPGTY
jgi:hypothetical protein